ncbi:hypothetical protein [Devosia ginsengisoli]|uniref:Uncharacterized protein n=1 Tax=Devosia ginsengisoli TaxID=400770 RepID=A0A5B8LTM9_9HYPH|nr:hypothetical protein [Devosia ginsengisoli]QDZ11618.1 hypothetical protein FPZ08_13145 [Devosia ginsengisoli]
MSFRLLMSARDAAAALHLVEIARVARLRKSLEIRIHSQLPARGYFEAAGIETELVDLPSAHSPDDAAAAALRGAARNAIDQFKPDAVLCGLSTPFDSGFDEAVVAEFDGPSFVFQDFWGEANLALGKRADIYLALDEEGVRLSKERHSLPAVAVGSPRHATYAGLDIAAMRRQERARLGIPADARVIGLFGQGLHHLEGYRRTLDVWIKAVANLDDGFLALYRPHPRESARDRTWTTDFLRHFGVECIIAGDETVEASLVACDVVCSAFSNCSYDAAYLNYFSANPLLTPVSLFFDEEIVGYFKRMVKLAEFPYLKAGLVKPVYDAAELPRALAAAAGEEDRTWYWRKAQSLANPVNASNRILDIVMQGGVGSRPRTGQ